MSRAGADRNLLLGIIALQMDFISRDALIAAMNAWILNKATPLGRILEDQRALSASRRALLDTQVEEHIKLHDGEPQKSLAVLSSIASIRHDLARIADSELWDVPELVQGDPDRITHWINVLTDMELDPNSLVQHLDGPAWHEHWHRLEELGGPPAP